MSPRNTNTGGVLESMVVPSLQRGGYEVQKQVYIGIRLGKVVRPGKRKNGRHKVDAIATKNGEKILVSSKWQQVGGTAEEKVPYEVMCMVEALKDNPDCTKAYVILGGDGWSLREFYISGGLNRFMQNAEVVKILTLERFIALANDGKL